MATSTSREKRRVRVTRKPKSCPNPLFEKWLKELKDEAIKNDSRLQYVYGKALKSLQKYPLVLESAKECKVLQHFGDGLCKMLDKKLAQHVANGGSLGNDSYSESSDEDNLPPRKVLKDSSDSTRRKSKEYIPARRSGAYGLMMALLKHTEADGHLKKKELQELAQPYADVSFAQTDVLNTQYYNAWSSMSTLVNKGLVDKQGNPARYQLTESGRTLAKRLDQAESELHSSSVSSSMGSNSSTRPPVSVNLSDTSKPTKAPAKRVAKSAAVRTEIPDLLPTTSRTPTKYTGILQPTELSVNPSVTTKAPAKRVAKSAAVRTEIPDLPTTSRTPTKLQTPTKSTGILQPAELISIDDDEFDRYPQTTISLGSSNGRKIPFKPTQAIMPQDVFFEEAIPGIEEGNVVEEQETYTRVRDKVTLKANEYEIVLCVDCAEVSGSSGSGKNQKETAAKSFQNCGVPYDVRKLSIGDYLWICKPKAGSGLGPEHELALPYVIERKRMDDVVSSIKDGRFKEQKFRLKHSGLTRPIYLIEEHGNRQNLGLPEASVLQAIANTLIIEKFQVQWTQKSDESVSFLVAMTKQLVELYRGKTVTSRSCQDKVGDNWQTSLVTFKELYVNSTKCKPLSVTQMFAKQLMQLHGLSGDRAEAIVKHYPTPSSLINALKSAGSSASTLLASIEYGKAKKKIGLVISGHLAKLYTEDRFDT